MENLQVSGPSSRKNENPNSHEDLRPRSEVGFPPPLDTLWSYRNRPATDVNLVKAARAAMLWRAKGRRPAFVLAVRYLGWLVRLPADVIRRLATHGEMTRRQASRSYRGQIADMVRAAFVNGVMPRGYYGAGLARYGGGPELYRYLPPRLFASVITQITFQKDPATFALSRDKFEFERRCRELGLPVVRTIAIARVNDVRRPAGEAFSGSLPQCDLILKPNRGRQGKGIERWRYLGEGNFFRDSQDDRLSTAGLTERASKLAASNGAAMLIQECAVNSPELRPIASSALATTRFVTAMDEDGTPEIVEAFYRTSTAPAACVDNFHSGGVLFQIDLATGRFASGLIDVAWTSVGITKHPETDTVMPGIVHPGWAAMSALALRLHQSFPNFVIVGWDIGFTPDGPVVTEANVPSGVSLNRQGRLGGVVGTRLFTLTAFHARRWLESTERPDSRWRARATSSAT